MISNAISHVKNFILKFAPIQPAGNIFLAIGCANILNKPAAKTHMVIAGVLLVISGWIIERLTYIKSEKKNEELILQNKELKSHVIDIEKLQQENNLLNSNLKKAINDKADTWLKTTANRFQLQRTDRISIYYIKNNFFYMLSRYSVNEKYKLKHRLRFMQSQSALCQAWENGKHINLDKIPHYGNTKKEKNAYFKAMKDYYGYDEEKTKKLTMKSCVYIAFSIKKSGDTLGLVLIESTLRDRFCADDVSNLSSYCVTENKDFVVQFIEEGIKYGPHINDSLIKKDLTEQEFMDNFENEKENTYE
nr:hypothetical protein [uncultured Desulfobacter sp.]